MSNTLENHWNTLFLNTHDERLGWYEASLQQTLKFLDELPADIKTAFIPGAGTSKLVETLAAQGFNLILNDISGVALDALRQRLGATANQMHWLQHDLSEPLPHELPAVDLWLDRAVLHFLLSEPAIAQYFNLLDQVVRPGGFVLLAEFSDQGASRCAGLDVHRYSLAELSARLGKNYELCRYEYYTYINPEGSERPYIYTLYRRLEN